jgi:hypothetical protein
MWFSVGEIYRLARFGLTRIAITRGNVIFVRFLFFLVDFLGSRLPGEGTNAGLGQVPEFYRRRGKGTNLLALAICRSARKSTARLLRAGGSSAAGQEEASCLCY